MSEYPHPELHPDPDSLNAFIEGVLPEHERVQCMAHLAECAECREIVFLAQDPVAAAPPAAEETIGFWERWLKPLPILGAAAAVAGITVLSVSLMRIEKPAQTTAQITSAPTVTIEPAAPALSQPPAQNKVSHEAPLRAKSVALPEPPVAAVPPAQALNAPPSPPSTPAPAIVAGTVKDSAGAIVTGATVTVHPVDGASDNKATTDTLGQYQVAGLPPGRYEVSVAAPGFMQAKKEVEAKADSVARADSTLQVGSTAQTVEVTASAAVVNTESAVMQPAQAKSAMAPLTMKNRAVTLALPEVSLPSKLAVVATVAKGKITLAIDAAGTLFRSDNAGKSWKKIKPIWSGNATGLTTDEANFRLTTDAGSVWMSSDGTRWASR